MRQQLIEPQGKIDESMERIQSPEIDGHKYSQLIFGKGAKAIQWGKIGSSINSAGTTGHPHANK